MELIMRTALLFLCVLVLASFGDADHLLLSEICVTPTDGEFVEIFNPTGVSVSLDDYYLCDVYGDSSSIEYLYVQIVAGPLTQSGSDFVAKFPGGASIPSEGVIVVATTGSGFLTTYGISADFDLRGTGGGATPMEVPGNCFIGGSAGLTNSSELVMLFFWDGTSDLCSDVDYAIWGDEGYINRRVDKTGISIDGPDAGTTPTAYLNDTPIADQDSIADSGAAYGFSFHRADFNEGAETFTGGNGITGHDETSEDMFNTWITLEPSPGEVYTALVRSTWGEIKSSF